MDSAVEAKLDFIIKMLDEIKKESKQDREEIKDIAKELAVLQERVNGHKRLFVYISTIFGGALSSLLASLGLAFLLNKLRG